MKKIVALVLAFLMLLGMGACGNSVPSDMSEEAYNYCLEILEIADELIAGKISAVDAEPLIATLYDKLGDIEAVRTVNDGDFFAQTETGRLNYCVTKLALAEESDEAHKLINEYKELAGEEKVEHESKYDELLEELKEHRKALAAEIK